MKKKRNQPENAEINLTRGDLFKVAFIGGIVLFLVGCGQMIDPNLQNEGTASPIETRPSLASPTEGDTQMTPSLPTPADPGLQSLIEKAKEDLAQRLAISVTQINLVEVAEVEWSDSSLGCPQAGMDYLQVITPGHLIRLEVNAQLYEYHSNRDTYFVYCENQNPPIIPKP
jgi:hypothetical protein